MVAPSSAPPGHLLPRGEGNYRKVAPPNPQNLKPETRNPKPKTQKPKPKTQNLKNPKPKNPIDTLKYHDIFKFNIIFTENTSMITRKLLLPPPGTETFFLWGPRQTGKSTLLRAAYPNAIWIDLLKAEEFRRYLGNPELLRQEMPTQGDPPFIVIDEVQKLPHLLDEVHWLHENRNIHFALCGSSARKVRRGHANLLGGRALRYELFGLVSAELPRDFDLNRLLNHGYLPRIYLSETPKRLLNAYVANYLKEEIAAEGLVRNLPVFSEFLNLAALSDTEPVNFSVNRRGIMTPL
ncbi:MAG: AAA family ATPase [Desulfobulbaceae bacterium]